MSILLAIINLILIALLAWRGFKATGITQKLLYWSALTLRLATGIMVGLIYIYYYNNQGDTISFFVHASRLTEVAYSDFPAWFNFIITGESPIPMFTEEPRSVFFLTIVTIVNFFTYNNYWISSLWFSLFSFWCSYRLVLAIARNYPQLSYAARVALLFVPSVVFWSSGIIKETIAFGALCILAIHFISIVRNRRLDIFSIVETGFYLFVLLSLKYYWAAVLLPSMLTSLILHWTVAPRLKNQWAFAASWLGIFALLTALATLTHPNFYPDRFLSVIVENYNVYAAISRPENTIGYFNLSESWGSMIVNSPWALFSGLFRPMIFETTNISGVASGLENLVVLILVLWKIPFIRMPLAENRLVSASAIVFIGVLCIFLALSTPNLGTLSRYRVGFFPFFILLTLADHPIIRRMTSGKSN